MRNIVVIRGIGGCGKTTVAAALAAAAGFDSGADCISSIFIVSP